MEVRRKIAPRFLSEIAESMDAGEFAGAFQKGVMIFA